MNSRDRNPLISVIIPTYNREKSLGKAIQSVLDQTYSNIELIVVDDGSVDKTDELLGQLADKRLRVIRHKENKGVCAAKNTGLDNISGDWFFIADSDDTLQANALEELINIPLNIDPEVNHITCNIIEYETNKFLGVGFNEDQHWDIETIFAKSRGEFKGLIKKDILGDDRLYENIVGREGILWAKIRSRSKGYYVHKGLYIVHKEGDDRVCKQMSDFSIHEKAKDYTEIVDDDLYWEIMEKYSTKVFLNQCLRGMIIPMAANDRATSNAYASKIRASKHVKFYYKAFSRLIGLGGPFLSKRIFRYYNS